MEGGSLYSVETRGEPAGVGWDESSKSHRLTGWRGGTSQSLVPPYESRTPTSHRLTRTCKPMTTPANGDQWPIKVLLVDDQKIVGEQVRQMLAGEPDVEFRFCPDPAAAIDAANEFHPTVILQD